MFFEFFIRLERTHFSSMVGIVPQKGSLISLLFTDEQLPELSGRCIATCSTRNLHLIHSLANVGVCAKLLMGHYFFGAPFQSVRPTFKKVFQYFVWIFKYWNAKSYISRITQVKIKTLNKAVLSYPDNSLDLAPAISFSDHCNTF